jgi:photosystem II stability/assembly factor-like uncharacterized protein
MKPPISRLMSIVAGLLLFAAAAFTSTAGVPASHAAGVAAATVSQTLLTIACPSVTDCYAGGNKGTLLATHDGGATWQSQSWPSPYRKSATTIVSIACPSTDACFALTQTGCDELGARVPLPHTADGGNHWATASIPGCGSSLTCPEVTTCFTIIAPTGPGAPAFVRTTTSGASWHVQARIDGNSLLGSLTCPTLSDCYLTYQNAIGRSTDGGKHWSIGRITGKTCTPRQNGCPTFHAVVCPGESACYTAGSELQSGRPLAVVISTKDGFRSLTFHFIPGLPAISTLSCPIESVCFALAGPSSPQTGGWVPAGATSRFAVTTDGGAHWRLGHITAPYPFNDLTCPSTTVCYTAGFLGRLMGTSDAGATWHDLIPALFLSGTYGSSQPLHAYSPWFTATQPWKIAVAKGPGPLGANGRPLPAGCRAAAPVAVYVRNTAGQIVAGPIRAPRPAIGGAAHRTVYATGKLRLDVVARCSSFTVRVDGVEQT